MPNFIISPYAISWESIRNQLENYIKQKTEDETWKDFYVSGAGQTVIEIAAALGAFYAYHFILGRRESYLSYAQNYTSIIGLSENNGYSVNKGTNLKIYINYIPSITMALHKWDVVGTYLDYDLVVTEDFDGENELVAGNEYKIPCTVGDLCLGGDTITIPTEKLTCFSFHSDKTTEDFRLLLNDTVVPTSTEIKDLEKDYWIALTNPYGSVDAFYLQQGEYKYHPNDTLTIQFIEKNNLTWSTFSPTNLNMLIPGEFAETPCELLMDRIDMEDAEQARIKAPLYHETSRMIRSRKDYSKYLLLSNPKLIDANDRDITPGLIEITYLTRDGSILTDSEIEYWLDSIEQARPSGVARAIISHPVEVARSLRIKIWKQDSGVSSTLDEDIDKILNYYNNTLGISLDLNQLEHDIERLEGVKIARVSTDSEPWQNDYNYKLFDTITNSEGNTFWVSSFNRKSGSTEPTWSNINIGDTVNDGELIWERVNESDANVFLTWSANAYFNKYDYIKKEILTNGNYGQSGQYPPAWGRQTVSDYRLEWTKQTGTPSGTIKEWLPGVVYNKNNIIKVSVDNDTYYYKCTKCYVYTDALIFRVINFRGKTSSTNPEWFEATTDEQNQVIKTYYDFVYDGNICWKKFENGVVPTSYVTRANNTYYPLNTNIKVDNFYYTATNLTGTSGSTEPEWPSSGNSSCKDNNIVWTLMQEDTRKLTLQWNEYFKLTRII